VAVAEAGNHTIVSVGVAVSVEIGVSVDRGRFTGRHATASNVVTKRSEATAAKPACGKQFPKKEENFLNGVRLNNTSLLRRGV
jgi:hypothetical protein